MLTLEEISLKNFRHYRDVSIPFSTDQKKPLTVIRSENGFGKTTLLKSFQWVLGGERYVDKNYRLSPTDWDPNIEGSSECETSVSLKIQLRENGKNFEYLIIRRRIETLEIDAEKGIHKVINTSKDKLEILGITESGSSPQSKAEDFLRRHIIPEEQIPTFFVDGDKAVSFIYKPEATKHETSKTIIEAINSLLQLEILKKSRDRVHNKLASTRTAIGKLDTGGDYAKQEQIVEDLEKKISQNDKDIIELTATRDNLRDLKEKALNAVESSLKKGGDQSEKLQAELQAVLRVLEQAPTKKNNLYKRMAHDLSTTSLIKEYILSDLVELGETMGTLEADGTIPETLPEVIRARLEIGKCICGEDASEGTEIQVELQSQLDRLQKNEEWTSLLTHLNNNLKFWLQDNEQKTSESKCSGQLKEHYEDYLDADSDIDDALSNKEDLLKQIEELPEDEHEDKVKTFKKFEKELDTINAKLTTEISNGSALSERLRNAESELSKVTVKNQKQLDLKKTLEVCDDLKSILDSTLQVLQTDVIDDVSKRMNDLWLQIIQHDNEQSNIKEAKISKDSEDRYFVEVIAKGGARYNIADDISGAQRRALTTAFILGLVLESGTKAPLIIDTPVGVASGKVRYEMVEKTVLNSHQSIIFFTRSELRGVEKLLKEYGGKHVTITKSDLYPEILKNDPKKDTEAILTCFCDYDSECKICELTTEYLSTV